MAIEAIDVKEYRSIRDLYLKLGQVNVLVGPNGCGKSNLYNSMYLLHEAAAGRFAQAIADEGGMPSVLWAGGDIEKHITYRSKEPVRMKLGVTIDNMSYEMQCGLPGANETLRPFKLDPRVKEENVYFLGKNRSHLLERKPTSVWLRDAEGNRQSFAAALSPTESVLSQLREPHRFPQLSALRENFLSWRFYHQFRTDIGSPIREQRVGVFTPVISHDGRDLAAALITIMEIGDREGLNRSVAKALAGAVLKVSDDERGHFEVMLRTPGIYRVLEARELSDGTLRYLCLLAALMTPRPPTLLALNEPETSLHPDLLEPLAELIVKASEKSQIWITTHSTELAGYIEKYSGTPPVRLEKVEGATKLIGEAFGDYVQEYGWD